MSYQVLARKWRPKSFNEVVGQRHVLTILSNALSLGRVHHAYLFSGTRGVGKTSIARLLAKGLNCETGITATPCGVCDNCQDIEQGRFVDLLEIDAASRTKVEDTREILDNIQYLPTKGRFKVYLIDEVHMLSRSSFNALLKTLEEPPEHVKFLLATTDPQKLPITILSRCLHLHLNVLEALLIDEQLVKILTAEQLEYEQKALHLLSKAANGSMRDALSLTDQAIALGNGKIDENSVKVMLGTLDSNIPFSLIEALHGSDGNALMAQIEIAAKQGADWDSLLSESIALLHQIALLQIVPSALGDYSDNEERIRFLAQYMAPNDVQLFYQILLMGRKDLPFSPDKKMGVEMSFLRALAFIPKQEIQSEHIADITAQEDNKVIPSPLIDQANNADKKADKKIERQDQKKKSQTETTTINQDITEKTIENHGESVDARSTNSEKSDDNLTISEEMPSMTKNILEMRMKLMQGEQSSKKSELVERIQPNNPSKLSPLKVLKEKIAAERSAVEQSAVEQNKKDVNHKQSYHINDDDIENENTDNDEEELITAENYQWQSTQVIDNKDNLAMDNQSFFNLTQKDRAPEIEQRLIDEVAQKDSWSHEIEQLDISPLIKQIAVNSFIEQQAADKITLHVRSAIKHLTNAPANINKLAKALSVHRKQNIQLQVVIDDNLINNEEKQTPLEMREIRYQQKLEEIKIKIRQDEKIAMICQFFEAQIDESSIRLV